MIDYIVISIVCAVMFSLFCYIILRSLCEMFGDGSSEVNSLESRVKDLEKRCDFLKKELDDDLDKYADCYDRIEKLAEEVSLINAINDQMAMKLLFDQDKKGDDQHDSSKK